jgi:hypothetical protein
MHTPELQVEFTKRKDGAVVLHCLRRDGTVTWQRHEKQALFFSFHDLTHFAVETTMGFQQGFYGLIADGWDITDTTGKGIRGKLPSEAILVEHVVGLLDREGSKGVPELTAADFNEQVEQMISGSRIQTRRITEAELVAVRHRIRRLHEDWARVPPGGTLELSFERTTVVISAESAKGKEASTPSEYDEPL